MSARDFYAAITPQDADTRTRLCDHLAGRFVASAMPAAIVLVDDLPRNPSGKVDRRSLPSPDPGAMAGESFIAPETDTEHAVAEIWAEVLGVERLGAIDDFFVIGGHSLLVTRAVNRMRQAFAIDVPVRLVFEHATVRTVARQLERLVIADVEAMTDAEAARLVSGLVDHERRPDT